MPGITIVKTNGGLGRTLPSLDHVSGLLTYNDNIPAGFASGSITKAYSNLLEVEADGIVKDSVNYSNEWYHASEYFRIQPDGKLYLGIAVSGSVDYSELEKMQKFAEGEIRQIGIVATNYAYNTAEIDKVQLIANSLEEAKTPIQFVMSFNYDAITTVDDLPDLATLSTVAPNVSVIVSQDGDAYGYSLSATNNAAVGAALGAMSLANVYESIGWTGKFNIASTELDSPILAFGGIKYSDLTASDISKLEDRNYLYIKKYSNQTGSYFNDDKTADAATSDYNQINLNRVYHKALRKLYDGLFPLINSPVKVVSGGLMTPGAASTFETAASKAIGTMQDANEISNYSITVPNVTNLFVDPTVYINVRILPIATAKEINVTLGYSVNI